MLNFVEKYGIIEHIKFCKKDDFIMTGTLNEIQNSLIGILIPTIITSIISILTLTLNIVIQLWTINRQYKSRQYEIMREQYPKLKSYLIQIQCYYDVIEKNKLYTPNFSLLNYLSFDWEKERQNISVDQVNFIDEYEENVKALINSYSILNDFFAENNFPTSSKKVQKEINSLQLFCSHVKRSKNITYDYTNDYNKKKTIELIATLDKHYNTF